jgi:murein L,D-transpeptidase YafK
MLHGMKDGFGLIGRLHTLYDWTDGCIAVTNSEIDEIFRVVPVGTPIRIEP